MKYNGVIRAFSFVYPASSLYSLIADGNYRQTNLGRNTWKGLISGSSLQRNCNKEGFNTEGDKRARLGIIANEQNDCRSPDSFLGLGTSPAGHAAGNLAKHNPDNGHRNTKVMGYILVR